jgi:hypothetical protein
MKVGLPRGQQCERRASHVTRNKALIDIDFLAALGRQRSLKGGIGCRRPAAFAGTLYLRLTITAEAEVMRVLATSTNTTVRDAAAARRAGAGGFSLSEGANAAVRNAPGHLQAISGVDVLALDALDALKLGLLSGSLDQPALDRLRAVASDLTAATGDQGLDSVVAEIDLRVQVEIAKLSRR